MTRDILDLKVASPLGSPLDPPPDGQISTMSNGWDDWLWRDVADTLGIDARRYGRGPYSQSEAVGLALVLQCADVKARDMAGADMTLWRETGPDQYEKVRGGDHWFARMLARKPNPFMTWQHFWRAVVLHLELAQNAYIVKDIARDGTVRELIPVQPFRVTHRVSETGRLFYEVAIMTEFERVQLGADPNMPGGTVLFPEDQVIHLTGRSWNGRTGISNLELGAPLFSLMRAINDFQQHTYANKGALVVAFETDQAFTGELGDQAFRKLKNQLAQRMDKGEPFLLEAGLKAKVLSSNARDAMTEEAYKNIVHRVCGMMQCPPHKIYAYEGVKYDNLATENNDYANSCLIPLAKEIESSLRFALLTDDELDVLWPEFDRLSLMAGDMKTLGELLDLFTKNGTLLVNEVRERLPLALPPLEGGNVRYVPVSMAVLDENNNVVVQAASGQNQGAGAANGSDGQDDTGDDENRSQRASLRLVEANGD